MSSHRSKTWIATAAAAAATVCAALPLVAQSQDSASPQQIYRQDRAACMAGQTTQSQADCLNEARSALRDRMHGDPNLDDSNDASVARAADGVSGNSTGTAINATPSTSASTDSASSSSTLSSSDAPTDTSAERLPARADRN